MRTIGFSMTSVTKPLKAYVKFPEGDKEGLEKGPYEVIAIAALAYEDNPNRNNFSGDRFERTYLLAIPNSGENVAWTEQQYITRFEPRE